MSELTYSCIEPRTSIQTVTQLAVFLSDIWFGGADCFLQAGLRALSSRSVGSDPTELLSQVTEDDLSLKVEVEVLVVQPVHHKLGRVRDGAVQHRTH